tara:strand:+ start:361 stop:816 length:456 start_codon:yes stop_codon:yes gene_type:complete
MGLREILDDLLPADTPAEVTNNMMAYAKKHPEMSEAEVVAEFEGSMSRAKRKKKEKDLKGHMDTAAAKRTITQAEGKKSSKRKPTGMSDRKASVDNSKSRGGTPKKTAMMRGGMANGKQHMYAAGGSVTDNAGLRALKKASPTAYNKITQS